MRILAALLLPLALATHYEDPKDGCGSDEQAVRIQGVTGDFCSPKCKGSTCPTDPPSASDAKPTCALHTSTGAKYCALICDPSGNSACPKGASCQSIQGTGICTYPSATTAPEIASLSLSLELVAAAWTPNYEQAWRSFKENFGKAFVGEEVEAQRFEIFKSNLDIIYHWNAKNLSFQLGVNEFAHLSPDEFAASHLGLKKPEKPWGELPYLGTHVYSGAPLADSVDWTTKGAVTPVKNQAQCGSCWAFSTTGSLEGAWEIKSGNLVSLSEQQFVDCDKVDSGCQGGLMDHGFAYAEKNALCTEDSYAYHAKKGQCKASSCTVGIPLGGVTGYKDVSADSEQALQEAVQQQPVSIAIEADKSVFQLYKSGVLSATCGSKLDHGVLAVGYGTLDGKNYWKVKNSWGKTWGMNGYVNLARGKSGAGECGILSGPPSYPVVTGKPGPSPGPAPPGPSPTPPAPPTPPGTSHYEKPPCQSGEVEAEVQGADGSVCAPPCDGSSCPTDVPAGTKAKPQCILQDSSSGKKYCALECILPGSCPTGAKCARIGGIVGVCVYPTSQKKSTRTLLAAVPADTGVINI